MSSRYVESLFRAASTSANKLDLQSVLSSITSATAAASAAPLDHFYARIGALNGPFFPCGWGNLSVVNYEEDLRHLIQSPPSSIKLTWRLVERGNREGTDYILYEGTFRTPCLQRVFDALPPESRTGRVQLLMPARLQPFLPDDSRPTLSAPGLPRLAHHAQQQPPSGPVAAATRLPFPCGESRRLQSHGSASPTVAAAGDGPACVVHLAATGDQTFGRRLNLGFPLLKDNVCSLVLESPFYGARRPAAQRGSKLLRVSDLLTLGWATIAESINLLHWLREEGYGPLGMCGLSMGGVHACMTAGLFPGDVAVAPLLAPRSAAVAYCDGAMRAVMAWEPLLKEVDENDNRIAQVLREAGRPITVQLPAHISLGPGPCLGSSTTTTTTSNDNAGPPSSSAPGQSVALIREATYALADLEVRGEQHHLAAGSGGGEGASGAGGGLPVRTVGAGAAVAAAQPGPAAGAGGTGSTAGGRGAGGAMGLLKGLPFVSVMDIYGRLAGEALRVGDAVTDGSGGSGSSSGGGGGRDIEAAAHGQTLAAGGSAASGAAAAVATSKEEGGPFSGVISTCHQQRGSGAVHSEQDARHHPEPHHPHHHQQCQGHGQDLKPGHAHESLQQHHPHHHHHHAEQSKQQQQQQHNNNSNNHQHHSSNSDPRVTRPHPPPHAPDMPFPRLAAPHGTTVASPASGSGSAAGDGAAAAPAAVAGVSGAAGGTVLGRRLLGDLGRAMKALRASDRRLDSPATVMRLKSVLETYTDITRYPLPRRTDAAVIVAARDDAYVSTESVRQLHRHWPGSELRMVSGGHVSAFLLHQEAFRGAIRDSLTRLGRAPPPQPQRQQS